MSRDHTHLMGHDAAGAQEAGASETPSDGARLAALAAGAGGRLEIHRARHGRLDQPGDAEVAQQPTHARRAQRRLQVALRAGELVPVVLNLLQTALAEGVETLQDLGIGVGAAAQGALGAEGEDGPQRG